jgi:hypothetical protein
MAILDQFRWHSCFIILLILFQLPCDAQSSLFVENYSINDEFGDIVKSLQCVGNDLVFVSGSVVEIPEDRAENRLVKIDSTGQLTWSTIWLEEERRYLGSFQEGLLLNGDSVLATTNTRNGRGSGYLALVSTSLETGSANYVGRFDDTTGYEAGTLFFAPDSSYLLEVSSRLYDVVGYYPLTVTNLSLSGEWLSEKRYFDEYLLFAERSTVMDAAGNLYVAFKGCRRGSRCNPHQAWISKIGLNGGILWTRNYGETAGNQGVEPYLTLLSEDRMALAWTRDTNNLEIQESPPIIYVLDLEGEKLDSIAFHGNWRTLSRIQTAANGDIIGAGYAWTDIGYTGWMIRVTSDAELVWERYIQDNRLADNVNTELRDIDECADGSIAAAGLWISGETPRDGGNTLRSWVVKLDANGCLEPGCSSDTIHLKRPVAVEEVEREPSAAIQINPNPVEGNLHLEISGLNVPFDRLKYTIASSGGSILQSGLVSGNSMDIAVGGLPSGLHFFSITDEYRLLAVRRFIKH